MSNLTRSGNNDLTDYQANEILMNLPLAYAIYLSDNFIVSRASTNMLSAWGKDFSSIGLALADILDYSEFLILSTMLKSVWVTGNIMKTEDHTNSASKSDSGLVNHILQPVKNSDGKVYAILHTVVNVIENEDLQQTIKELAASESRFRTMVQQAPVAISILRGPDHIIESANDMILKRWGKGTGILNLPLKTALPELEGQPFLALITTVYQTGKIYIGHEVKAMLGTIGELKEFYLNFIYKPLKDKNGITTAVMVVATDVTDLVKARKHHQKTTDMLQFSVEAANIGTWSKDLQTGEVIISGRHKELFGFYADETVVTEDLMMQIPADYRAQVALAIETVYANGGLYDITYPTTGYHDGKLRWTRALGSVMKDEQGNASYFSGVSIETTLQKQDELRKNHFINIVSHELKTPLTSLKGYIQLLQQRSESSGDSFMSANLHKVDTKLDQMTSLINGFLNVSQLESGKIQLNIQHFDISLLIREITDDTNQQSVNRKFKFINHNKLYIDADRGKIAQVISNLLSNAVKYSSPENDILISCGSINDTIEVYVKDTGIGISLSDQNLIFERYYRVESTENKLIAGFGIGLYLCSEIIQRHNGKLYVESTPGKGSTFYFTLPVTSSVQI